MSLMIAKRLKITGADFDSTLAVTADAAAWSSGTAYVVGDQVIRQRASDLQWFWYEAIQAGTNKDPNIAANIGTFWVLRSAASRSIPFDDSVSQSPAVTAANYYWRVAPTSVVVQYIGVFGAGGDEMKITKLTNQFDGVIQNGDSEDFANATYFAPTGLNGITSNAVVDPLYGLYLADTIIENSATSEHGFGDALGGISFTSGLAYAQYIYIKRGSGSRDFRMQFPPAAFPANCNTVFTLSGAGSVSNSGGCTGTITSLANGWYLCVVTATANATATTTGGNWRIMNGGTLSYTGDGTSSLHVFGLNLIQGSSFSTYYCKFAGEAFTRSILKTHEFEYNAVIYPDAAPYNPSVLVATGSTPSSWYEVQITKNSTDNKPRIGEIVFGYDVAEIGDMVMPLDDSLLDFSVKTRDDFGNISLIKRNVTDDVNYTVRFDTADRTKIKSILKDRRGQPLMLWNSDDPDNEWGMLQFAFLAGYSMPFRNAARQIVSIDTEGLT